MSWLTARSDGVSLALKVKASAKRGAISSTPDHLSIHVQAPAVDGKANAAVLALLAERLGCSRSQLEILRGEHDSRKVVLVRGATVAHVEASFAAPR